MQEKILYTIPEKNPELNIWLSFPAMQTFGMSSLGYMSIVKMLDSRSDFYVEKIFTDTTLTKIKPSQVDVIGFSVSFEIDFLGIFNIMDNFSIPFNAKDRDDSYPIIFGGGPVLTTNPEPFANFFDFIIIGDAENADENIFKIIYDDGHQHMKRAH